MQVKTTKSEADWTHILILKWKLQEKRSVDKTQGCFRFTEPQNGIHLHRMRTTKMNFMHSRSIYWYLCVPHSLLKAGDTKGSSEIFASIDVQWTINSQIRKCKSVPNNSKQNKVGCRGWTAWGGNGWIAILLAVLDVLLIDIWKKCRSKAQAFGWGQSRERRWQVFLRQQYACHVPGTAKG